MPQFSNLDDTIVAIATPLGQGGIGIVRLSGKNAVSIADRMFLSKSKKKPSRFKNFTVHYGDVARGKELIDEALLTVMRAPRSYTREDVVEISSHGGSASSRAVLRLAVDLGARPADPGEFTKRAFLNGRIDLAQAEAVLDTIHAKTEAFLKVSAHQLKGELSTELEGIREELMNAYVAVEAIVNFPEDDTQAQRRSAAVLAEKIRQARQQVGRLLATGEQGRILKEGIKIVICGKPNVGKSSLLNVLLKQPRAIVSPVAGTTRDTIEETAQIQGIPFQLVDTAGILEPRDLIEEEAVRRSHMHIQGADLVLFILDASVPLNDEDQKLVDVLRGQNFLIVFNKCDLQTRIDEKKIQAIFPKAKSVRVSALKKEGVKELEDAVVERVWHGQMTDTKGVLVSNMRHVRALRDCLEAVQKAEETLASGLSLEFVSEEIKRAVNYLDTITGRHADNDLLEQIFAQFCIGK
ncbi:MAG: tRNA uridine-5-carboxymethylaminomethyl(34) synthesis GTPase MnmE [Candidatus Omnitrophica bacterium]|nr:tRNA uridine-5-carboxymethylaminomethyl(34) synthesis GTPase MnmE [Candidatus Omnitrophota bacterium]